MSIKTIIVFMFILFAMIFLDGFKECNRQTANDDNIIPAHLRSNRGIFLKSYVTNLRFQTNEIAVKLKIVNDSRIEYYTVIECEFTRSDGEFLSKNTVVIKKMKPYYWRHITVRSSRGTEWGAKARCRITKETYPIGYAISN